MHGEADLKENGCTVERERILASLRERIVAFAASRIGRDEAEDLAQDVLLLLETKYRQVEGLENLLPLAFRILRYRMLDSRRKSARRGEYSQVDVAGIPLAGGSDPGVEFERHELERRLMEALPKLETRCRDLFRLKLEGKSFVEIRTIMGVASVNTVYTWDFRCRKRLLELLGGSWEIGA